MWPVPTEPDFFSLRFIFIRKISPYSPRTANSSKSQNLTFCMQSFVQILKIWLQQLNKLRIATASKYTMQILVQFDSSKREKHQPQV